MELKVTLLCIGVVLAILAAGAWKTLPQAQELSEEVVVRLKEALVDQEHEDVLRSLVPPGSRVLQVGGVGLGHNAALWGATAVGDVKWARKEHPDVDFREKAFFLPESFTHVVVRDVDEVEHKERVFQDAHKWLEPGGVLVVHSPKRYSKGDVKWTVTERDDRRTETLVYHSKTWRETRRVYRESASAVDDMVLAAGFVSKGDVYVKSL